MAHEGLTPMTKVEVVVRGWRRAAVADLLTTPGHRLHEPQRASRGSVTMATTRADCCSTTTDMLALLIAVMPDERATA